MIKDNREEYRKLIEEDIVYTFKESSVDNEIFSVDYEFLNLPQDIDYELAPTAETMVRTIIKLRNKNTGEYLEAPLNLLQVPVYTQIGYKIGGTSYQILELYKRASGWYILSKKNREELPEMELTPNKGFHLSFKTKHDKIKVSTTTSKRKGSGEPSVSSVSLPMFLKAITGHSYLELANMLGLTNKFVMMNFNDRYEPSRAVCIEETLRLFTSRSEQIIDVNNKITELERRLFTKNFMNIGPASYVRLKRSTSFYERALNKTLARPITVGDKEYNAGQLLHETVIKEIDESDIETLYVRYNNKVYELKKYPITEDFSTNEILTMVNMYCCALDGFDTEDSRYDLSNRVVYPFPQLVCDELSQRLSYITQHITDELSSKKATSGNLPDIINNIKLPPTDIVLNNIKQSLNQAQTGDNKNIVAFTAKNYKITTDFKGRATEDMTKVQDSQLGLLDSIDAPESSKIGMVHHRNILTKSDENGFLTSPYYEVKDGKVVSEEPVYLTAEQKNNKYIATWDETFENPRAMAYYNGRVVSVPINKINYKEFSVLNNVGPARAHITFPNHSNGKRLLMGGNMIKQAVSTFKSQRPFVSTGAGGLMDFGYYTAEYVLSTYYLEHHGELEDISFDDFIKLEVHLDRTKIVPEYRKLYFSTYVLGRTVYPTLVVPFMMKNTADCVYTTRINAVEGNTYSGEDIVAYNVGMDIKHYDVENYTDYGGVKVQDKDFQRDIAIGNNLIVAYKTFESSTIDDAITISSELVYDNTLTSINLKEVKTELTENNTYRESFGFERGYDEDFMTPSGIPVVGSYLKPGSLVIAKYGGEVKRDSKGNPVLDKTTIKDKSLYLDNVTEGQVVFAEVQDKFARVLIAEASPIEVGDKLAGRYGNKGVVAKIVDEKDMPYDPVTGMRVQVILNPLGIPSRMNISQELECVLAFAMKKLGKVIVISPDRQDNMEIVKKYADMAGVKPMMLRDGRTGQMFKRPMNVGVLYMLKLEHMVRHKINAINIPTKLNSTLLQPRKGRSNEGGQAFGEMETWCLMSLGADKVLQDLMSLQSDDYNNRQYLEQYIKGKVTEDFIQGNNGNDNFMQYLTRSMGVEIVTNETTGSYDILPLTDKLIQGLAERPLDYDNNPDWLHDPSIFGYTRPYRQLVASRRKWGYIPLNTKMIHPLWLRKSDLNKLIIVDKEKVNSEGETDFVRQPITPKDIALLLAASNGKKVKKYINLNTEFPVISDRKINDQYTTGISAVIELFEQTSLDVAQNYYMNIATSEKSKQDDIIFANMMLNMISLFNTRGITLSSFIINYFPIMPQPVRIPIAGNTNRKQDFDILYTDIARAASDCKKYKSDAKRYDLYMAISAFIGYETLPKSKKNIKSLLSYFTGKDQDNSDGLIRDNLLSKRLMFSGRTVIVPVRNPKIRPTQIGIPFAMCVEMWQIHLVTLLKNKFETQLETGIDYSEVLNAMASKNMSKFSEALNIPSYNKDYSREIFTEMYDTICDFISKQTVLSGRQPSLHRYSVRAFHPVVTTANAIEIHPLVCKGYNADFDGDQMWVAAMITESAARQAFNLMSANTGILNPKDNSIILEHTQDIILGVYFATMLHNNIAHISFDDRYKEIRYYNSLSAIQLDVKCGMIEPQDLVCYNRDGNKYLSTAGRILFNSLIPGGFTDKTFTNPLDIPNIKEDRFKSLRFDGLIKKKADKAAHVPGDKKPLHTISLDSIIKELFPEIPNSQLVDISHDIFEFGIYYSDISGISLTLDDLVEHPMTSVYIEKAKELETKINDDYALGLITEEGRKNVIITIYSELRKRLSKIFFDAFDRNNNLFIMSDSGARGNLSQMMQTCGIVGVISKSSSETLETPVLGNYAKGLRSYETHLVSHGTRMGVSSTQTETSKAGYSTRQAVYMCNNFKVVTHDCGKHDHKFKVRYGAPKEGSFEKLLRKHILPTDENAMRLVRNMIGADNRINGDCAEVLLKHKVKTVHTKEGIIHIDYELDKLMKSLLVFRESPAVEGEEPLPYLIQGNYISEKTLEYIEKEGIEEINARTMLDCHAVGGVCSKCYGLRYDTIKLPMVGEIVGIESAQCIGEPSAQLVMSTFHGGGLAGTNVTSGVAVFESLLKGSVPTALQKAQVASSSGYVSLDEIGNMTTIELNGKHYKENKSFVLVKDGEYVVEGQPLTMGTVVPDSIGEGDSSLWNIRRRQFALLDLYFDTFMSNNILINARHFEVLVREQTSLVKIVSSDDDRYKAGETHFLASILDANNSGKNITYTFQVAKQSAVISHYSGALTALSFEDFSGNLAKLAFNRVVQERPPAPIGKLFVGQDLTDKKPKPLAKPKYINLYSFDSDDEAAVSEDVEISSIIETIKGNKETGLDLGDMFSSISLDDIISSTSEEPTLGEDEIYINMDNTETQQVKKSGTVKSKTSELDAF